MTTGLYKKGMVLAIIGLFIGTSIIPSISGNEEDVASSLNLDQLDQFAEEESGYGGILANGSKLAQSFTPSLDTLSRIQLKLWKQGNPSGNLLMTIRNSLTGNNLLSFSIPCSTVKNDLSWIEFNFPDLGVTPYQKYYIVLHSEKDWKVFYDTIDWKVSSENYENGRGWWYDERYDRWHESNFENYQYNDYCFRTYGYNSGNQPPTVQITQPTGGTVSGTIPIQGTASDSDGTVTGVEVRIDSGSWWTASGTTSWSTTWDTTTVSDGSHTIYARSKDNDDAYSTEDSVTVNVNNEGENQPPIADAGGPYSGNVGQSITFDGSGSYDPDGSITGYRWDWTNDGTWDTGWSGSPTATHSYGSTYTVKLQVEDNDGATDTDTATVTISSGNQPPEKPGIPIGPTQPSAYESFDYSSYSIDFDGDDIQYGWDWNGDDSIDEWTDYFASGEIVETSHIWNNNGIYDIKVKAKDINDALSPWSDSLTINVQENDYPPGVPQIKNPDEIEFLKYFEIEVRSFDVNGDQVKYNIDWGDGEESGWSRFYPEGCLQTFEHVYDQEVDKEVTITVYVEDSDGNPNEGTSNIYIIYNGLEIGDNKSAWCYATNYIYNYNYWSSQCSQWPYCNPVEKAMEESTWWDEALFSVAFVYRNYDDGHWYYKFRPGIKREVLESNFYYKDKTEEIYISYSHDADCGVLYDSTSNDLLGKNVNGDVRPDKSAGWDELFLNTFIGIFLIKNPKLAAPALAATFIAGCLSILITPEEPESEIDWEPIDGKYINAGSADVLVDVVSENPHEDDEWNVYFGGGVKYEAPAANIKVGQNNIHGTGSKEIHFHGPIPPIPSKEKVKYLKIGVYCPVNVTVYSPNFGSYISKDSCSHHGGSYEIIDLNDDGELDRCITFPYGWYGSYTIFVEKDPDANPNDTFSIIVDDGGEIITLIDNMLISDVDESIPIIYSKEEPAWVANIDGASSGKANRDYTYTLSSNCLYGMGAYEYLVDWGDNTSNTLVTGPFDVNETVNVNHTWTEKGTYTIRVKVKDQLGDVSDWATLEVSMPKNKAINPFLLFLERLIERFPILEQIIQLIYDKLAGL